MKFLLSVFLLLSFLWSCHKSENGYQSDFRQIVQALEERHPGLADYPLPFTCRTNFQQLVDSMHASLVSIDNNRDFYFHIMPFIHELGDGHAWVSYSSRDSRYLPLILSWFGDDLHVVSVLDSSYNSLKYAKVLSIGSYETLSLERLVNKVLSSDMGNHFHLRKAQFGNAFWMGNEMLLREVGAADSDSIVVILEQNFHRHEIRLPFAPIRSAPQYRPFVRNFITAPADTHFYRYHSEYQTVYCQFGSVAAPLSDTFTDELMETARNNKAKTIVLDLRRMSGGDAQPFIDIFRYCISDTQDCWLYRAWQRNGMENREIFDGHYTLLPVAESMRFHGQIVIFMGKTTYSAGTFPVVIAKDNDLALLIGEPCGNNSVRYGQSEKIKLCHSGLTFSHSTKIWQRANPFIADGIYIKPHVEILPSIKDYQNMRDPVWDYFVQNISNGDRR
ncbi:hypothetical protein KAR48_12260 [bacterium]|nr:hypothetical protein [bacterium]